jgi:hypothetical protein
MTATIRQRIAAARELAGKNRPRLNALTGDRPLHPDHALAHTIDEHSDVRVVFARGELVNADMCQAIEQASRSVAITPRVTMEPTVRRATRMVSTIMVCFQCP